MKIAIDVSPLKTAHRFRGIGTYTQNLITALQSIKLADFEVILIEKEPIPKDCDLIHYPFFDLFFATLPLIRKKKTVVTIHDTIPLVFPKHYPPGIKGRLRFETQKMSLRTVDAVITDSKNSKKDIVNYLGYPKEKIFVVPLAPGKEFKKLEIGNCPSVLSSGSKEKLEIKEKYRLPETFLLYVGDVNYSKNIPGLIKASDKLKTPFKNLKLVLVGKAFEEQSLKETEEILQLIKALNLNNQIKILGWVPNKDLPAIYNLATVYCQPSFYEGFGLPVLEAMACGTPVVAAKTSSLPEICGDAAMMVDPYDINDIAKGIKKVLDDKILKDELIKKGLGQAKKFSWEKTAKETIRVYQNVYQENK